MSIMSILEIFYFCLCISQTFSSDNTNTEAQELKLIVKEQNEKIHELENKYEKLINVLETQSKVVKEQAMAFVYEKFKSLSHDMDVLKNKSMSSHNGLLQKSNKARMGRQLFEGGPVAFYAVMTQLMPNVGAHHQLVFDAIKTNVGGGYHPSGVFIVPESGIYVFTWSFRVRDAGSHAVELTVNGNVKGVAYGLTRDHFSVQTSATIVISVNKGDDVYLRTGSLNNKGEIYTDLYGLTYFAGWKI